VYISKLFIKQLVIQKVKGIIQIQIKEKEDKVQEELMFDEFKNNLKKPNKK